MHDAGNKGLCGKPLPACKSSKKKTTMIIVVAVVAMVALSAIVAFSYICCLFYGFEETTLLESVFCGQR